MTAEWTGTEAVCHTRRSALSLMWARNSWPAPQALSQQPPTPYQSAGSPEPGAPFTGLPSPSQGHCHVIGCWTEKPMITQRRWALALGVLMRKKNSGVDTVRMDTCPLWVPHNKETWETSQSSAWKHTQHTQRQWQLKPKWILKEGSRPAQQPWSQVWHSPQ